MNRREIHIQWQGPLAWKEIRSLTARSDRGIYQVYGSHPLYGADVLLYIGKTDTQTFGKRLHQETFWQWHQDFGRLTLYVGRLAGSATPREQEWSAQIDLAERLLIVSHTPAVNAQKSIRRDSPELQSVHIFNWGSYRSLMPEVSGYRWTAYYDKLETLDFGTHRARKVDVKKDTI
jgi:hypothetical protein